MNILHAVRDTYLVDLTLEEVEISVIREAVKDRIELSTLLLGDEEHKTRIYSFSIRRISPYVSLC
jgi:predicted DNA-binding protein YlxM (UPF0122 family)